MLILVLGDEDGMVCKLTAWREVADAWAGGDGGEAVKRGDVIFVESTLPFCTSGSSLTCLHADVMATWDHGSSPTLTASPFHKSKMEICYRTMPYTHEDNRLRPDLRLGESDAAVRKVGNVVRWFEGMAGLNIRHT